VISERDLARGFLASEFLKNLLTGQGLPVCLNVGRRIWVFLGYEDVYFNPVRGEVGLKEKEVLGSGPSLGARGSLRRKNLGVHVEELRSPIRVLSSYM